MKSFLIIANIYFAAHLTRTHWPSFIHVHGARIIQNFDPRNATTTVKYLKLTPNAAQREITESNISWRALKRRVIFRYHLIALSKPISISSNLRINQRQLSKRAKEEKRKSWTSNDIIERRTDWNYIKLLQYSICEISQTLTFCRHFYCRQRNYRKL